MDKLMTDCCAEPPRDPRYTQSKDWAIRSGNDRGRVGKPGEVAAMNSTTAQKVAETGLTLRQPL